MNRITLLTAEIKAETWAKIVLKKHMQNFASLMEEANVSKPFQKEEQTIPGGNTVNQSAGFSVPGEPQRNVSAARQPSTVY